MSKDSSEKTDFQTFLERFDDLIDLVSVQESDIEFLYELFLERAKYPIEFRTPLEELPTFEAHKKWIMDYITKGTWYDSFYIIRVRLNNKIERVGSIVMKKDGEWGYHVLMKWWKKGIGLVALKKLIKQYHDKVMVCNCRVGNINSIHMAEMTGHKRISITYRNNEPYSIFLRREPTKE